MIILNINYQLNNIYQKVKIMYRLLKIIIIGESGVGKSSLLSRYSDDTFSNDFLSTIGVDFKMKQLEYNNNSYKIQIWDTAGQERFRNITKSYYRSSNGVFVVFDVTDAQSFEKVEEWINEASKYCTENYSMVLVGTKADLENKRVVSKNEANELAQKYNISYVETSSKNNSNVENAFNIIIDAFDKKYLTRIENDKVKLKDEKKVALKKKSWCSLF
jgi:Ras-related protein Rab-1A